MIIYLLSLNLATIENQNHNCLTDKCVNHYSVASPPPKKNPLISKYLKEAATRLSDILFALQKILVLFFCCKKRIEKNRQKSFAVTMWKIYISIYQVSEQQNGKNITMYILASHKPNVDKEPKSIKLDAETK